MSTNCQYISKISTATIGLNAKIIEEYANKHKGNTVPIITVYGIIRSYKPINTMYGGAYKFEGVFEAVNLIDNNIFRSNILYVPSIAEYYLKGLVDGDIESNGIKFGFNLTVTYRDNNKGNVKFVYSIVPLLEYNSEEDILNSISKELYEKNNK